ncbi:MULTISPECIES: alternate-type signal peptide domain-containing protein [unclassified Rhodococcus (in: high G+C Gram-positive bacteria)]|uniref:alternate-type signal peptide domain-containing protein n=1 Tax=unclassified Rhodococcus (in: high G+C Gram-positive bacteria) TaxID=192944 RepID=UPI0029546025|nr:alternate-type signal peptide domain-containing protein [Rhodococcus sp. IEGM 1343]MDV8055840.1 alternate-type signal peptide domain-containing protein [Rhodococcus sp. IEGM 1343]
MNKATKGAIAAGAAAVLLLGGLGSYALWQDTETVAGGTINSGELNFAPTGDPGVWTDVSDDIGGDVTIGPDPSGYLIVPGDVLTYDTTYDVNFAGENLEATITANFSQVAAAGTTPTAGSTQLAAALAASAQVSVGTGVPLPNGAAVELPLTTSPQEITVKVTLVFNEATTGLIAQNGSVNLNAFTLTLDQVRPLP